jgi:hypothetical protein
MMRRAGMKIEITSRWAGVVLAFGLALTLTGGYAWAANRTSAQGTITACAKKTGGALRLMGTVKACNTDESLVSWSQSGPAGPAGAAGPAGPKGSSGISGYQVVQHGSSFSSNPGNTAQCPAGKKVLGGGFYTEESGHPGIPGAGYTQSMIPTDQSDGWSVRVLNHQPAVGGSATDIKVQAYAICANVG